MTTLTLFTTEELEAKKLTDITDHYNEVAKAVGLKAVKKFRDKPTAISRTAEIQETYHDDQEAKAKAELEAKVKVLPPQKDPNSNWGKITSQKTALQGKGVKAKADKSSGSKGGRQNKFGITEESIIELSERCEKEPAEGTIEHSIYKAVREYYDADARKYTGRIRDLIPYIIEYHKRPRSSEPVDAAYVLHNIKWFIKKGHLKVS